VKKTEIKDRIKSIRKKKELTQVEFGQIIGVKGNTVTNYETGLRNPTEAVVKSICREFNVNEHWLRTGEGKMFIELTKEEEIATFIGGVLRDEDDSFKKRLISGLAALDETGWEVLENFLNSIQKKED
jgi:HTH-type transcriptional regulator / antitoxin PezA